MYSLAIKKHVDSIFSKLSRKKSRQLIIINKKICQILKNPYHFKPLRAPLQHLRRVHVDKSFVLVYAIDEKRKTVIIWDYKHHDKIYKK